MTKLNPPPARLETIKAHETPRIDREYLLPSSSAAGLPSLLDESKYESSPVLKVGLLYCLSLPFSWYQRFLISKYLIDQSQANRQILENFFFKLNFRTLPLPDSIDESTIDITPGIFYRLCCKLLITPQFDS